MGSGKGLRTAHFTAASHSAGEEFGDTQSKFARTSDGKYYAPWCNYEIMIQYVGALPASSFDTPSSFVPSATLVYSSGNFGVFDQGERLTNLLFSYSRVFYRVCSDCQSSHKLIFYMRKSALPVDFSVYSQMTNLWQSANNLINVDFNLFSSYDDLLDGVNSWKFCNYDDNLNNVPFPRDCGPVSATTFQWSGSNNAQTYAYYVLLQDSVSPSRVPTDMPFVDAAPTPRPSSSSSSSSSSRPTINPTVEFGKPTPKPTVALTVKPTVASTQTPTPLPTRTPTPKPTSFPSSDFRTRVQYKAAQILTGISKEEFLSDSLNTDAFRMAVADAAQLMHYSYVSITYPVRSENATSTTNALINFSNVLRWNLEASEDLAAANFLAVNYTVSTVLGEGNTQNQDLFYQANDFYSFSTQRMQSAVSSGSFLVYLRQNAITLAGSSSGNITVLPVGRISHAQLTYVDKQVSVLFNSLSLVTFKIDHNVSLATC